MAHAEINQILCVDSLLSNLTSEKLTK